jgi:hypothetical protein
MGILDFVPLIGQVLDRILPDEKANAEAKLRVLELAQKGELAALDADLKMAVGQLEINKAEASSNDPFRAGWRPAIGYICAGAMAFQYLVIPLLLWGNGVFHWNITPPDVSLDNNLWELMFGMLGLGGLRTYEKMKGVTK